MFFNLINRIRLFARKDRKSYSSYYKLLGFYPKELYLYDLAFRHRSLCAEHDELRWTNNERLEYLGDAILGAVVSDILYKKYPKRKEGFLTEMRSRIVKRDSLNRIAAKLELNKYLNYNKKMHFVNRYVYGNALEALIGAVYLDQGYRRCYRFIEEKVIDKNINLDKLSKIEVNFKSNLIEWSQKNKLDVSFDLLESHMDDDGNMVFESSVSLSNMPIGFGTGLTKKGSHQLAAKMAVYKLRTDKELQQQVMHLIEQQQHADEQQMNLEFEDLPTEKDKNNPQ